MEPMGHGSSGRGGGRPYGLGIGQLPLQSTQEQVPLEFFKTSKQIAEAKVSQPSFKKKLSIC
jgi:hypothetical protein